MSGAQSLFEKWINNDPLTEAELDEIESRAQAMFEDAADGYRKGEH